MEADHRPPPEEQPPSRRVVRVALEVERQGDAEPALVRVEAVGLEQEELLAVLRRAIAQMPEREGGGPGKLRDLPRAQLARGTSAVTVGTESSLTDTVSSATVVLSAKSDDHSGEDRGVVVTTTQEDQDQLTQVPEAGGCQAEVLDERAQSTAEAASQPRAPAWQYRRPGVVHPLERRDHSSWSPPVGRDRAEAEAADPEEPPAATSESSYAQGPLGKSHKLLPDVDPAEVALRFQGGDEEAREAARKETEELRRLARLCRRYLVDEQQQLNKERGSGRTPGRKHRRTRPRSPPVTETVMEAVVTGRYSEEDGRRHAKAARSQAVAVIDANAVASGATEGQASLDASWNPHTPTAPEASAVSSSQRATDPPMKSEDPSLRDRIASPGGGAQASSRDFADPMGAWNGGGESGEEAAMRGFSRGERAMGVEGRAISAPGNDDRSESAESEVMKRISRFYG